MRWNTASFEKQLVENFLSLPHVVKTFTAFLLVSIRPAASNTHSQALHDSRHRQVFERRWIQNIYQHSAHHAANRYREECADVRAHVKDYADVRAHVADKQVARSRSWQPQQRSLPSDKNRYQQGCGTGSQISGSGSSSGHLNFLVAAPTSTIFDSRSGTIWSKKHCIICTKRLPKKLCLFNGNPNFRLLHLKLFGSGSSHPKLFGLRPHSPGYK